MKKYVQYTPGGAKFRRGKLTKLEELELYDRMSPKGGFQMFAPSINNRSRTAGGQPATASSSGSSPEAAAAGEQGSQPSEKG